MRVCVCIRPIYFSLFSLCIHRRSICVCVCAAALFLLSLSLSPSLSLLVLSYVCLLLFIPLSSSNTYLLRERCVNLSINFSFSFLFFQKKSKARTTNNNDEESTTTTSNNHDEQTTQVKTVDQSSITDESAFGSCEPGTSVVLQGIVWNETDKGKLEEKMNNEYIHSSSCFFVYLSSRSFSCEYHLAR